MARTDDSLVQGILLRDYVASTDLAPFIDFATLLLDRVATCATSKGFPLTDAELEVMETWIAAHLYVKRQYKAKRTADSSATWQDNLGEGLKSTSYGQMALALDPSGCLQQLTSGRRANLLWLGKPPSAQIPFELRD